MRRTGWIGTALLVLLVAGLAGAALVSGRSNPAALVGLPEASEGPGAERGAGPDLEERSFGEEIIDEATVPGAGVRWDSVVEVAAGEAYQGPWRMNRSDFRYVDAPSAAITSEGDVGVVWVDQARKDVLFRPYGPEGEPRRDEAVNVSRSPDTFSWLPRVAIPAEEADRVYVLWQEIVFSGGSHGGEIFFARSTDGGRRFGEPVNLSDTPAGAGKGRLTAERWDNGSLDLVLEPEGALYVAWTEYEGALWFRRSTDGGGSFDPPVRVAGGEREPARGPSLAAGPDGRIHLVWTVGDDPAADVRYAASDDGGRTFGSPRVLHQREGHADGPKLAADSHGSLHLVWGESPDGRFGHYRILYAASRDGGATFGEPREISGAHGEGFESVNFPSLAIDGMGRLFVTWELFPDRREFSRGLGFTSSPDGGRTFRDPTLVPGTAGADLGISGSLQGLLTRKLAANEAGTLAIVNSTFLPGRASRVRLIRGHAAPD